MERVILFILLWLGCSGYALLRGGAPEKIGGAMFLVAALLSAAVEQPQGSRFDSIEVGVLLVDFAVLAGFVTLAIMADRFWPLWMSGMQGVALLSHFAVAISPDIIPWGYWKALTLWSYPMLLLLAGATMAHRRRLMAQGVDPSWRRSSRR